MSKKKAPIPIYTLNTLKHTDIYLRPLHDYLNSRPPLETAHSDSYYIFIFQQSGESHIMVDFEAVSLIGPCGYFIIPGQIHHFIASRNTTGWILAAEPLLIDQNYRDLAEKEYGNQKPMGLEGSINYTLGNCLKSLSDLLANRMDGHLQVSLLSHMVSVCAGLFISTLPKGNDQPHPSRSLYLNQQFKVLLKSHFNIEKKPSGYAGLLNVSPSYLNECVKSVSGRPVSYWINQQIVLEAKRLLAYSKLDVKEIAYKLGYLDDTYFIRLFKRSSGVSPAAFRKATLFSPAFT